MQLGMIGLGRMGANIVRRLLRNEHDCVVFNRTPDKVKQLTEEGAQGSYTLDHFVQKLDKPRAIWLMVPAGEPTEQMVKDLEQKLEPGDILIDGGNSYYIDIFVGFKPRTSRAAFIFYVLSKQCFLPLANLHFQSLLSLLATFVFSIFSHSS
jgi:6-phosphogluconate dehydrogenase (decarboxylating)